MSRHQQLHRFQFRFWHSVLALCASGGIPSICTGAALAAIQLHETPIVAQEHAAPPTWTTRPMEGPGISYHTFESDAAHATVSYHLYLPPDYDAEGSMRYPVLYWLHGSGGGERGVPGLARMFDNAIRGGKAPPMIVVFPNGLPNGMWCDSVDGRTPVETVVIKELVPLIDKQFRTIASRKGRMIEGFSMGGYGAARMGFKYHDLFGAVSILGGGPLQLDFTKTPRASRQVRDRLLREIYGNDMANFQKVSPWMIAERNAEALRESTTIRQVVGDQDETLPANIALHEHLDALGIGHEYVQLPGVEHNPMKLLQARGDEHWAFYRRVFGEGHDTSAQQPQRLQQWKPPTHADVAYGPHERNVMDVWLAESDTPTPVLVSIHGGGFRSGHKGVAGGVLRECLKSGISVVTITYRLSDDAIAPAQFHDAARAVQFIRHSAENWNIDPERIAATGGSAGAGLSLWLGFHDDLADPDNDDPVLRQSSRLTCMAVYNGQTTYDPRAIRDLLPESDFDHASNLEQLFDVDLTRLDALPEQKYQLFEEVSPLTHLSNDDVPVLLIYAATMDTRITNQGIAAHHPRFGKLLKDRMDELAIECKLETGTDKRTHEYTTLVMDFLRVHLLGSGSLRSP